MLTRICTPDTPSLVALFEGDVVALAEALQVTPTRALNAIALHRLLADWDGLRGRSMLNKVLSMVADGETSIVANRRELNAAIDDLVRADGLTLKVGYAGHTLMLPTLPDCQPAMKNNGEHRANDARR